MKARRREEQLDKWLEEAKVDEPNVKKGPMAKVGAKNKPRLNKSTSKTSSAVTSVKCT